MKDINDHIDLGEKNRSFFDSLKPGICKWLIEETKES